MRNEAVGDAIRDLVEFSSKTTHRTGLMLNWIALRVLNDSDDCDVKVGLAVDAATGEVSLDIAKVLTTLPDFTDQTFIDQVMAADPKSESSHVRCAVRELFHKFLAITAPPISAASLAQTTRKTVIANVKTYVNVPPEEVPRGVVQGARPQQGHLVEHPEGSQWLGSRGGRRRRGQRRGGADGGRSRPDQERVSSSGAPSW